MRPLTIILLVVALAIAGLTAFLAKRYLAQQSAASTEAAAQRAAAIRQVLVANADLPIGQVLKDADVRWQDWPENLINPRFIIRGGGEDARNRYIGAIARTAFASGEPLQAARVFRLEGASTMAGLVAPGMRAISIEITSAKEVSGFVLPGDRVDLLVTYELKNTGGKGGEAPENVYKYISETILRNVRVLAADQTFAEPKDAKNATVKAKTVTLEVTDKQAETVALAGALGAISLTLRSVGRGGGETESPSYTTDMTVVQGIRDSFGHGKAREEPPLVDEEPVRKKSSPPPSSVVKVYRGPNVATQSFGE